MTKKNGNSNNLTISFRELNTNLTSYEYFFDEISHVSTIVACYLALFHYFISVVCLILICLLELKLSKNLSYPLYACSYPKIEAQLYPNSHIHAFTNLSIRSSVKPKNHLGPRLQVRKVQILAMACFFSDLRITTRTKPCLT